MAHGNGGTRHDVQIPYDAKRCPALGGDSTQPSDSRQEISARTDNERFLPIIPVMPHFDEPEAAVKKGGRRRA